MSEVTGYYVSIIDGPRKALLFGPLGSHAEALAVVEPIRKIGCELDPRAHWYAWGTAQVAIGPENLAYPFLREGSVNAILAARVNLPANAAPVDIARHLAAGTACK